MKSIFFSCLIFGTLTGCMPQQYTAQKLDAIERVTLENARKLDLLMELKPLLLQLDEAYRINQTITNRYEKDIIKKKVDDASVDDLLDFLRSRLQPNPKAANGF